MIILHPSTAFLTKFKIDLQENRRVSIPDLRIGPPTKSGKSPKIQFAACEGFRPSESAAKIWVRGMLPPRTGLSRGSGPGSCRGRRFSLRFSINDSQLTFPDFSWSFRARGRNGGSGTSDSRQATVQRRKSPGASTHTHTLRY